MPYHFSRCNRTEPWTSAIERTEHKTPFCGHPNGSEMRFASNGNQQRNAVRSLIASRGSDREGCPQKGVFSCSRIRGLSGVAGKNRHDSGGRKPQGVVPPGGRLHVLNECGRGAQKIVQAPAGDFWKISTRVKRVDCRSSSHRAANVPGMTGKADEVASVCSERDGEYDRPTDRRDFHPKHRSCPLGCLGRTLGGVLPRSIPASQDHGR